MGVSIGWRKIDPKSLEYVSGKGSLLTVLEGVFGGMPLTLNESHVDTLRGIEACGHTGARELIDAILDNDSGIEVVAEW